ncbi:MAG: SMC-Scp complex subunit ScpB [Actinomycetota bacterium]|nr:SMC-Scp complex subunit ScpB [Actinomycetota bacterium]
MGKNKKVNRADKKRVESWLRTCVEGILFVSEGIVKAREISSALGIKEKKVNEIINSLENEYINESRGFIIKRAAGGFRLYSNPSINDVLANFIRSNIRTYISQAALETLAIICYRQPVTRTRIAEIRGVRADSVIITLQDKGLIKEAGKLKEPGNPMTYKVTDRFLEILGLESLKELPPLKDFSESD